MASLTTECPKARNTPYRIPTLEGFLLITFHIFYSTQFLLLPKLSKKIRSQLTDLRLNCSRLLLPSNTDDVERHSRKSYEDAHNAFPRASYECENELNNGDNDEEEGNKQRNLKRVVDTELGFTAFSEHICRLTWFVKCLSLKKYRVWRIHW